MSSTSSQELAASASGSNEPECELSPSVRSSRTLEPSSKNTGLTSPATTTLEPSPALASGQTAFPWMSSAEASPAKTSAAPASRPGFAESAAACGASTPVSLAKFDPATSSWRTSQLCLVALASGQANGSALFSGTWPRSGLMRNGTAYRLPPLALATDATESGLWQTPVADDAVDREVGKFNSRGEPKLSAQVKIWPTPCATDASQRSYQYDRGDKTKPRLSLTGLARLWPTPTTVYTRADWSEEDLRAKQQQVKAETKAKGVHHTGNGFGLNLAQAVRFWPTPNAGDYKAGMSNAPGRQQSSLPRSVGIVEGVSSGKRGGLNPTWVEWLMGFPTQWTELENWVTPSSRKSRKLSDAQSCAEVRDEP